MNDGGPTSTVEHFDPNEYVGDGSLQAGKLDSLARETVGTGVDPVAFDQRVC
jgi:hypothetical protein